MQTKELLSNKIAGILAQGIKSGFYPLGSKMPGEMELCKELGVSRATLREAIKRLESMNLIEIKRGIGTFVSEKPGNFHDPMGIDFICLSSERHEIYKWVKEIHKETLETITLFKSVEGALERLRSTNGKNALEHLKSFCFFYEFMAGQMKKPFLERHLIFMHQCLFQVYAEKSNLPSIETKKTFKSFITAVEEMSYDGVDLNGTVLLDALIIDLNEEI